MKQLFAALIPALVAAPALAGPAAPVTALAYSPDGKLLAAGTYREVALIDPGSGNVLGRLPGQTERVTAVAFSKDGRRLAVASGLPGKSGELRLYNVPPNGLPAKPEHTWPGHKDIIYTLAFSPDGLLLGSAGYDRVIRLWNPADPKTPRELKDHSDTVYGIAFHPQGKLLASASADRAVKVWDVSTGARLHTLADSTDWVYAVTWSPDGKHLAAAGVDKSIRVWDVTASSVRLVRSAFAHTQPVNRLMYSSDSTTLFSSGEGAHVKRWDADRLKEQVVFPAQPETILSLALRPDDRQVAVGRFDGVCLLVDAVTGKPMVQALPEKPRPPTLMSVTPSFAPRGQSARVFLEGKDLAGVTEVVTGNPAVTIKLIPGPRGTDRVEAELQIAPNAPVGPVNLLLRSGGGDSAPKPFVVDRFAAVPETSRNDSPRTGTPVKLPATLVGVVDRAGDTDYFRFPAQAGQTVGVQVVSAALGSKLDPVVELVNDAGQVVAESANGLLGFVCPRAGTYAIGIRDREFRGGPDFGYRIHAGNVPVVTGVFPLGVQRGRAARVTYRGVHLGGSGNTGVADVTVPADAVPGTRVGVPVPPVNGERPLGDASVIVGEFPEKVVDAGGTTRIDVPGTANGVLDKPGTAQLVEFGARKGDRLMVEVHARRIGTALDPFIEILDASNKPVMRATLRCVARTFVTFRDHDSASAGIRIETWNELATDDYLYVDGELMRIHELPKNPDDDCQFYQTGGQRLGFLDTTPTHHSQGVPMYKVEIHPPGSSFPPNGMPVFELPYRNDDGGPGYGKDARISFDPPADGTYRVRVTDARGAGGETFGYRLTVRPPRPDFSVSFGPSGPAVWKGGAVPLTVTVNRTDGFDGRVAVTLENVPTGFEAPPTFIEAGQNAATVALHAVADAKTPTKAAPMKVVARATVAGKEIVHEATAGAPSAVEPGDIVTTTAVNEVSIQPGSEARLLVRIDRRNGFRGRVPLEVRGLPHGVRVLDIGLNGILVTERDSEREVAIYAEPWVQPMTRPFVVLARREGKNTEHAAPSVLLRVGGAKAAADKAAANRRR